MSHDQSTQLARGSGSTRLEVTTHTSKASALKSNNPKLSRILRRVREEFGPMKVTVVFQTSRARSNVDGQQALQEQAQSLLGDVDQLDRLKTKVYYADPETKADDLDLIAQRITAKVQIATSADGEPRASAALKQMLLAAGHVETELREIVGVPRAST